MGIDSGARLSGLDDRDGKVMRLGVPDRRSPRSRGAAGVGDVAGERGDRSRVCSAPDNSRDVDAGLSNGASRSRDSTGPGWRAARAGSSRGMDGYAAVLGGHGSRRSQRSASRDRANLGISATGSWSSDVPQDAAGPAASRWTPLPATSSTCDDGKVCRFRTFTGSGSPRSRGAVGADEPL